MSAEADAIVEVFRRFDTDGNGVISKRELSSVLTSLDSDLNPDELLEIIDRNNDGKIQYAEFIRWLTENADGQAEAIWEAADTGMNLPQGAEPRLGAIIKMSPHLAHNPTYQKAMAALESGDERSAFMLSDRLLLQIEGDARRIDAAFARFDYDGTGTLNHEELRAMFTYLGFPDPEEDDDVKALVAGLDKDGGGEVGKMEFQYFVEEFGGCDALFAMRRGRVLARRDGSDGAELDMDTIHEDMAAAGIEPEAQAYWELVLPESELAEVSALTECQKQALSNIRHIAQVNHAKALPRLQRRVVQLGFQEKDLWTTLSWVRDFAPIIVHFHFDKMAKFLKADTHYRSQFETGSSCGLNNRQVRERWERDLFQGAYDGCRDFERPKYGVLNVMNDYRGVVRAKQYGDGYMIVKDARLRTTFSPEDSANLKADRLACLDYYAHVLNEYTDSELTETLKVASSGKVGTSDAVVSSGLKYKEAQYHGEIAFARHVERIVLPRVDKYTSRKDEIDEVCAMHGWEFCWMDEEKERRENLDAEHGSDEKIEAWKAKLKAMAEAPKKDRASTGASIPDGFCMKGCGRPVAPGSYRGKPFKTCCRGCAMGFGHESRCGVQEGERPPCKIGCGCLAAPGTSRRGNPLDTCCRGCVRGEGHDARCRQDPC